MKWLLIFILVHTDELSVMQVYDSEEVCREHGALMYEEFKVSYMCANMNGEVLHEVALKELDSPYLSRDYINAAKEAADVNL